MRWRRDEAGAVVSRMIVPIGVAALALVGLVVFAANAGVLPILGLGLAAGLAVASLAPLWKRNLRRTPLFTYGMVLAHLGIAVSLAGMASETAFTKQTLVAAKVGEPQRVGPYSVTLEGITPVLGPNWSALQARLKVQRDGGEPFILRPQSRFFSNPVTVTSESAIATVADGQLYTVLGQPDEAGRWQLRLWWKPFVTLIWLGGGMIALGGALSLLGRVNRDRKASLREAWA